MNDLHAWKASKNITDREIAAFVGVSPTQIYRIRAGLYKPSTTTAEKLSELTGIPAWNFMKPDSVRQTQTA